MDPVVGRCNTGRESPCDAEVDRIAPHREAAPFTHPREASVGADDDSRRYRARLIAFSEGDRPPAILLCDGLYAGATLHFRSRPRGAGEERFLQIRMVNVECCFAARRRRRKRSMLSLHAHEVSVEERDEATSRRNQVIEDTEPASRGNAPGQDVFAADAVLELHLALQHEYCSPFSCHRFGERSTTNAASNRDDVEVHVLLPHGIDRHLMETS